MRYFIEIAYNGTAYCGWQQQPKAVSIQETIVKALSVLLRSSAVTLTGAGRTDAGVHASQTFAHFDASQIEDIDDFKYRLNAILPKDIAVVNVYTVSADAHARFDAKWRTYQYKIHRKKEVFLDELSWHFPRELDVQMMNNAAAILTQHTNFQCFSKIDTDVNSFACVIRAAHWQIEKNQLIFTITANRFLRNMVRAIVGTLVDVGLGKITLQQFEAIIASRNRCKAGFSAPAHGLYLSQITYDFITLSPDGSDSLFAANLCVAADKGNQRKPAEALQKPGAQKQLQQTAGKAAK